ncbi:MAG: hypothetical protein ACE5MI_13485 [Acidimicrobiia bacterium]
MIVLGERRQFWLLALGVAAAIVLAACGGEEAVTTPTPAQVTTTQAPATTEASTTTEAAVTTTEPAPTTTTAVAEEIAATPVGAVLQPYPPDEAGGANLFPPGSVEANWYQWPDEGLYVVLYRGLSIADTGPLCAGNSMFSAGFRHVTNSPIIGTADELCVDAAKIAEAPSGVRQCDTLVYYVTEIPTDVEGDLFGTMEINDGTGFRGQTSTVATDLASTPVFTPDLAAYSLPASGVDDAHTVACG